MARLTKSRNRWIDGVLGGLGMYFNVNSELLRVCFLVAVFVLDWHFLITGYIIMMIIMPGARSIEGEEVSEVNPEVREREVRREPSSGRTLQILGIVLILAGISFIVRYQFPNIWYSLHDYLRIVRHTFGDLREIFVGLLLIVVGYLLLIKPKRG
jgi:phage shock protein PspC (stress-responsive transcriptional regulator)